MKEEEEEYDDEGKEKAELDGEEDPWNTDPVAQESGSGERLRRAAQESSSRRLSTREPPLLSRGPPGVPIE